MPEKPDLAKSEKLSAAGLGGLRAQLPALLGGAVGKEASNMSGLGTRSRAPDARIAYRLAHEDFLTGSGKPCYHCMPRWAVIAAACSSLVDAVPPALLLGFQLQRRGTSLFSQPRSGSTTGALVNAVSDGQQPAALN